GAGALLVDGARSASAVRDGASRRSNASSCKHESAPFPISSEPRLHFAFHFLSTVVSASSDNDEIEEGLKFQPRFDAAGLVTCVATDAGTGQVLMVAHMNEEALRKTIASGEAWYYSRSRKSLWRKGETSGHVQRVVEMRLDCDQDAVWIKVEQAGPGACHTGRRSCFYRAVPLGQGADASLRLEFHDAEKAFDPHEVYGGASTPKRGS